MGFEEPLPRRRAAAHAGEAKLEVAIFGMVGPPELGADDEQVARIEPQRPAQRPFEGRPAELVAQRPPPRLQLLANETGLGPAEIAQEIGGIGAEPDQRDSEA